MKKRTPELNNYITFAILILNKSKTDADAVSPGSEGPRGADAGALYLPRPATGGRAVSSPGQASADPQRGSY